MAASIFWMVTILVIGILVWDVARRWLDHEALIVTKAGKEVVELSQELRKAVERQDSLVETQRAIMKGFIDSMTAIVKISEEEKQHLINKVAAAKMGKKI